MKNVPKNLAVNKNTKKMVVSWKDGHDSYLSFSALRFACPCVECRGGHDQMSGEPPSDVFDQPVEESDRTNLVKVESVGSYGISISWRDGHSAGIYNWDYLRLMCPCKECRDN